MIIETPYKANDTITIKTAAGEEIVARFIEENGDVIKIEKPLALIATQQGVGLGPFSFTTSPDAKLSIRQNAILFVHKTEESMAKQYVQNTSGLTMV